MPIFHVQLRVVMDLNGPEGIWFLTGSAFSSLLYNKVQFKLWVRGGIFFNKKMISLGVELLVVTNLITSRRRNARTIGLWASLSIYYYKLSQICYLSSAFMWIFKGDLTNYGLSVINEKKSWRSCIWSIILALFRCVYSLANLQWVSQSLVQIIMVLLYLHLIAF